MIKVSYYIIYERSLKPHFPLWRTQRCSLKGVFANRIKHT